MFCIYDTRHREVQPVTGHGGGLRMYVCGPTVYRFAHVGNLRSYLLADLIRRNARRHGLVVTVCQNITDVGHLADDAEIDPGGEDKVLAQARAEGKSALELARFYTGAFWADCAALNIAPPDFAPRASESIGLMTAMVTRLIETGHAYATPGGSVYFDARSFPGYGEISGNRLAELRPGHRLRGGADPAKRFHADWALWKGAAAGRELTWPAPWGTGFPGWHTECSAMSLHYLGEHIDIHTGGIDLRFPHHEDERAQSDSVAGHEVVAHWVHGEHLLFDGRKMAKSAGNVVLLADLDRRGLDPLALRLALLEHRYRQQMNLTWDTLAAADRTLRRWRDRVGRLGRGAEQADVRPVHRRCRGGAGRRPGHPGRAAGAAGAGARRLGPGRVEVRIVRALRPGAGARPGPGRGAAAAGGGAAAGRGRAAGGPGRGPGGPGLGRRGPAARRAGRARRHRHRHPRRPGVVGAGLRPAARAGAGRATAGGSRNGSPVCCLSMQRIGATSARRPAHTGRGASYPGAICRHCSHYRSGRRATGGKRRHG